MEGGLGGLNFPQMKVSYKKYAVIVLIHLTEGGRDLSPPKTGFEFFAPMDMRSIRW